MKKHMKWAVTGLMAMILIACQKETPATPHQPSKKPTADLAELMGTKITVTYPNCTMGKTVSCTPGTGSCMLRYPPNPNGGAPSIAARFHSPVVTGQGSTGNQMAIEFLSEAPGLEEGFLGPEDLEQPMIDMHVQFASSLGYSSIEIVNQEYIPVFTTQYPHGYVIIDCIPRK